MYHKVPIQKLSRSQIMKLLKGLRIRVKHGSGHEIHASEEQHKKIMNAHKKGCGTTIQFDPFQQQMEEHQIGKGFTDDFVKFLRKDVAPVAIQFAGDQLKKHVAGEGVKKTVLKRHTKKGKGLKEAGFNFLRKTVAPAVIDIASDELKKLAVGEGMRKKKPSGGSGSPPSSSGDEGGALYPAGYGLMPAGHGLLKKKRGRPSKKGKGVSDDILSGIEKYGPEIAMTALPLLL